MKTFSFNVQIGKYTRTFTIRARTVRQAWAKFMDVVLEYTDELKAVNLLS